VGEEPLLLLLLQAWGSYSDASAAGRPADELLARGVSASASGCTQAVLVRVKAVTSALPFPEGGVAVSIPPQGGMRAYTLKPPLVPSQQPRGAVALSPVRKLLEASPLGSVGSEGEA
jgi:hypothetical protein